MIESKKLKGAAKKGLLWSAFERIGSQGIQFIFGIMVTRILMPEDYGLLGIMLIFIAIGQTLIDSGFASALIWKRDSNLTDFSTVFYFNVAASVILYAIVYAISPLIASFYDKPELTLLIRVLNLNLVIISFSIIQQVLLQKRIDFKILTYINIISAFLSGGFSLWMAYEGFGVWAIIGQILSKSLVMTILLWVTSKWRPQLVFSWKTLRTLFSYGSRLSVAALINTIFQYLYFNIIGKLFPLTSLGYYTRAVQIQEFPVKSITSIFQRVTFPVFATIQDDLDRLRNAFRKSLRAGIFLIFPVLLGLVAVSDELIVIFLTDKWLPASDYFKLLCLTGIFYFLWSINIEILKTRGKSNWVLNMVLITKIILVINIFITYRWGITIIIVGQLLTTIISFIICSFYVQKLISYSLIDQMKDMAVYVFASLIMFSAVILIGDFVDDLIIKLIIKICMGIVFYFSLAFVFKLEEIVEIKNLVRRNQT